MSGLLYSVGLLEIRSYRAIQSIVADIVKSHGLGSVSEWFVLSHVFHSKQTRATDLASLLSIDPPLVTTLVRQA